MKAITIYTARTSAEAALIHDTLRGMGIMVFPTEDQSVWGGDPFMNFFPIRVPADQVDQAREALGDIGLKPDSTEGDA